MTALDEIDAALLQDRLELLRLRTLLVGGLGMLGLVAGAVALVGYGSYAVTLVGQMLVGSADAFDVPSNLFQAPADQAWARTPVLLQLAFAAIGIAGIAQMTRQVLSRVQVNLWFAVLLGLAAGIAYTKSDFGSVWSSPQRELVSAVRAKEWTRVEQLSSSSQNTLAHAYVMAQVGLAKPDASLLQLHGKPLVDQIDDVLMNRGQDQGAQKRFLLSINDKFRPPILRDIDVAVYGAPHTQIGLSLAQRDNTGKRGTFQSGWALLSALVYVGLAAAGMGAAFALLLLWRRMATRLRWLRPWVVAAGD
jgi:hypothetical protein